jgi:hypothetical protein
MASKIKLNLKGLLIMLLSSSFVQRSSDLRVNDAASSAVSSFQQLTRTSKGDTLIEQVPVNPKNEVDSLLSKTEISPTPKKKNRKRRLAIIIGASLLLMAGLAAIAVPPTTGFLVLGNTTLTALNVTSNFAGFTGGVIGWISILLLDLLVSKGVYDYYKQENKKAAIISGGARLAYSGVLAVAVAQLLKITASSPAATIYNSLSGFKTIWDLGLIIFGLHLISLGFLFKNEGGKKWVNILIKALLITAGIGYAVLSLGALLASSPVAFTALVQPIL